MSLEDIAKKMCAKGKGILAADESTGKMIKRLNPEPVQSQTQGTPTQNGEPVVFARQSPRLRDLPPISICYSCYLPIRPNGACGCS